MLVLSRKLNESVKIGDDIEVFVAAIRPDKVRLAFSAPSHVRVHRKEVYDAISETSSQELQKPNFQDSRD